MGRVDSPGLRAEYFVAIEDLLDLTLHKGREGVPVLRTPCIAEKGEKTGNSRTLRPVIIRRELQGQH